MDVIKDNGRIFTVSISKSVSGFPCVGDSTGSKSECCIIKVEKLSDALSGWITFGVTSTLNNIASNKWIYQ